MEYWSKIIVKQFTKKRKLEVNHEIINDLKYNEPDIDDTAEVQLYLKNQQPILLHTLKKNKATLRPNEATKLDEIWTSN